MIFFISVTEYRSELEIDKGVGCPRVQRCKPCGSNSQREQAKRQNTARCGDIKGLFRHKAQTERPQHQLGTRLQAEGKYRRAHRGRIPPAGQTRKQGQRIGYRGGPEEHPGEADRCKGQQAAGMCNAPLTVSGENPLLGEQQQTVDTAPDHKMQRSTVPQTAQKKDRQRVQSTTHRAAA